MQEMEKEDSAPLIRARYKTSLRIKGWLRITEDKLLLLVT